ncbi:hypothetical protein GCM10007418_04210 [Halopseudomonas salina]|uniref:Uncharacterized protein n=1 Tax=Halopseudomonas salina TaxID=1323744 RepID=A0ABQ1P690_9GAMM|nr:hypothetical protein GCM10007418_04210 [Halopseudomonas salina]
MLRDPETGSVIEKSEAGGDTPLFQIDHGVAVQKPAKGHYNKNGNKLKNPGSCLWISPE